MNTNDKTIETGQNSNPKEEKKYFPLTHAQKRIYYDEIKYPGTPWANLCFIVKYKEKVDLNILSKAINMVILRNDGFRLRIVDIEPEPFQYVSSYSHWALDYFDFSGPASEKNLRDWAIKISQTPFNLIDSDLFYFACIKFNENEYGYYFKQHHIITDGWTIFLILDEVDKIYEDLKAGNAVKDIPNPSYIEYINDENDYLMSAQAKEDKEFWLRHLLPLPEPINLTLKKGSSGNINARELALAFPDYLYTMMHEYSKKNKTSMYKLIMSAISVYIFKIFGAKEVIIGGANHNRTTDLQKKMMGMFVSTMMLKVKVRPNMTFKQLVEKTGEEINYVLKNHQKYPFDRLAVEIKENSNRDMGLLRNISIVGHPDFLETKFTCEYIFQGAEPGGLVIHINPNNKDIVGILELIWTYQVELFSEFDITRIHQGLVNVLSNALVNPLQDISEIEILSTNEKKQVLYDFNQTKSDYPDSKTIPELFEDRVAIHPDNIAVIYRDTQLTYNQLNKRANQLARALRKKGVNPGDGIQIMVDRSIELVIGVLAILKAGGTYLPIDPQLNVTPIQTIIKENQSKFLVTQRKYSESIDSKDEVIDIDDEWWYCFEDRNIEISNSSADTAYIVYNPFDSSTEGGVMTAHRSIIGTLAALQKRYPVEQSDACLLKTPFVFDVSIVELFGWFGGGGRLCILEKNMGSTPQEFMDFLYTHHITHINCAPTVLNEMVNEILLGHSDIKQLSHLKYVFLSKETIVPEVIHKFNRLKTRIALINLYGRAETSVYATSYLLPMGRDFASNCISIGTPMPNTKIYILNFFNGEEKPVLLPVGIPGELCISGSGLALGYHRNEDLTNERFIDNPFLDKDESAMTYKRIYRTGDLARWLPDGNIEYLGRIHTQVKLKETRIERELIENELLKQQGIQEAVVVVRENNSGKYLCAYIVSDDALLDTSELTNALSKNLPYHLIPSFFIKIERIPLTPDGKANRAEMLDINYQQHQIQDVLAEIEAEVLRINKEEIDIDENFFRLGGQNRKAAQVASRIQQAFNVKISMADIFKRPTLRQLSEFLTEAIEVKYATIQSAKPKEYYPQSSAQKRLYFMQQLDEGGIAYNVQIMDIYCKGLERERIEAAFKELIKRHESIRTSFHMMNGEPVQRIHAYDEVALNFEIEYYEAAEDGNIFACKTAKDLRAEDVRGTSIEDVIKGFVRPFDLSQAPLVRVGFIKIWNRTNIFMLDIHHIIADGVSMGILARELWELYDESPLPPLRLQYKDFSEWLTSADRSEILKEQESFWLKEFAGEIPLINLPTDYPRPAKLTFDGDVFHFEIDESLTDQLKSIAKSYGETLYMLLFAIYNVLLAKLTNQEDIVVGTVTAGRSHPDLERIIGMFLNTLALRNYPSSNKTFEDFLTEVKILTFTAFDNQDYPYEELVSKVASRVDAGRNPLFDVVFGLENEADSTGYLSEVAIPDKSKPYDFGTRNSKFDVTLACFEVEGGMECTFEYKTKLFKPETIQRFASYFKRIIKAICESPGQKISHIPILPEEEKNRIMHEFNQPVKDYPADKTIHEIVEEHVRKNPDNPAVILGDEKLTYRELNETCNRLAVILREKGVGPNCIVALMTGRAMALIIAQLGILKAGGAYLSIDIQLPEARKKFLLEDSCTPLLLVRNDYFRENQADVQGLFDGPIIPIDDDALYHHIEDLSNPISLSGPDNLAYVIYTSGTTGKPKGVMMHHRGIASLNVCTRERFNLDESSRVLQFATVSFDASVWEVWMALMNGGALVLVDTDTIQNYERFVDYINKTGITITLLPPIYVNHIAPESVKAFKTLLTGGAAAGSEMVEKWRRHVQYVNCYGPTESSICCTMWKASKAGEPVTNPPIGIPVSNTRIHILDKNDHLVPIGVCGELCVSGFHVAIGYLNRPELTDERFVPDPIIKGNRMYRTGDLVRWMPDGNIEYFGRIDFQVKIRGFRIEPGEIENCIARHAKIKDVSVLALENKEKGEKYLCAYIVPRETITIVELKDYLHGELPEYMVPSYFVQVETIPLNSSGKVDKKALPEPQTQASGSEYRAPENEIQTKLAEAWQKVLGIERIGIQDDFFTLGGDSIKAIQIVSRLQKNKLKLEVNQMFLHKTIEELERYVKPMDTVKIVDQGIAIGDVELTPIQHWFFKNHQAYGHHFNQSVTLYRKAGFDQTYIETIFSELVRHHDALRMVYPFRGDTVGQKNRGIEGKLFDLEVLRLDGAEDKQVIQKESLRVNGSIDWENGPLVKLALFKGEDGDYLLIVIHHLVVDGVSWRILLEDFESAYLDLQEGKKIILQEKTDSFKVWAKRLTDYSQSKGLLNQLPYWKEIEGIKAGRLPVDHEIKTEDRKFGDNEIIRFELPNEKTVQLLTKVNWAYNTEINDILLTALGLSIKEWATMESILVNLEGHGREKIIEEVDINRTVGWFTTQYPVILNMGKCEDISFCIKNVKETLRCIPHKGIGYGILKYLTPEEKKAGIEFTHVPEIVFNYLGQFGGEKFKVIDRVSGITDLSLNDSISPQFRLSHKIDIEGVVDGDVLRLFFFYNPGDYEKESIEKLVSIFQSFLISIIDHCVAKKEKALTPSDLGYNRLPIQSLDEITEGLKKRISEEIEIASIYPLTAFQNEMFRSTRATPESYLVQNIFLLPAKAPTAILEEAFNRLIERHVVFRTVFVEEKATGSLQVVLKKRSMKIELNDVSLLNAEDKRYRIDQIKVKDRQRGFDLTVDLPLRLTRILTGEAVDQLIWSVNHIVIDGWCLGIVMNDLLSIYDGLMEDKPLTLEPVTPYRNYVEWFRNRDMDEGFNHWREYLLNYQCSSSLSSLGNSVKPGQYQLGEYTFRLNEKLSTGLAHVASENHVTLNTLFQVLWGIQLQKYLQTDDVIFGAIVSGRSLGVDGVEKIVGLFINIVPVRIRINPRRTLSEILKAVQDQGAQSRRYENLPLPEVLATASLSKEAIDNLMFFENYPTDDESTRNVFSGQTLKLELTENHEQIDYSFCFYVMPGKSIWVRFNYNALIYKRELIEKTALDFEQMVKQVIEKPDIDLKEIKIQK
ncbi:MAG: amino acid adenylation domain-containing protein [Candidatus Omnitrophota bacterium]